MVKNFRKSYHNFLDVMVGNEVSQLLDRIDEFWVQSIIKFYLVGDAEF